MTKHLRVHFNETKIKNAFCHFIVQFDVNPCKTVFNTPFDSLIKVDMLSDDKRFDVEMVFCFSNNCSFT